MAVFLYLNLLDLLTTVLFASVNPANEGNNLIRQFIMYLGVVPGVAIYKLFIISIFIILYRKMKAESVKWAGRLLCAINCCYVVLVVWNLWNVMLS